jgi:hypothetical protein
MQVLEGSYKGAQNLFISNLSFKARGWRIEFTAHFKVNGVFFRILI